MAEKDWQIKVYGQRRQGVFTVPQTMTQAFIEKLKEYEQSKQEG